MAEIEYSESSQESLDLIGALWQKLNDYHMARSEHFSEYYAGRTFERRKQVLLKKSERSSLHICLAHDSTTGELVGYCASTISEDNQGEIDSIYIEPDYRNSGIGNELMKRALAWMDGKQVSKKIVVVAAGNEELFPFYNRYGFYPARTTLEQVV